MASRCCGTKSTEIVLYVFQVILLVTGVAICVLGTWNFMITLHFTRVLDNHIFTTAVYLFLITGCLVILVFFLGCCAIPKRWTKLLFCYIILLVAIFLCEVLIGILAFVYQGNVAEDMKANFNETIIHSYKIDESKTSSIDYIQENLHCCGSSSFYDWSANSWIQNKSVTNNTVPDTCCKTISFECGTRDHPSNINVEGCMDIMIGTIQFNFWLLALIVLGLSVTHVIGIVCGIILYLKLESKEIDANYSPQNGGGKETLLPERDNFL